MAVETTFGPLAERLVNALRSLFVFVVVVAVVYGVGRFLAVPLLRRGADLADLDETLKLPLLKVTGAGFAVLGLYVAIPLSGLATTPATVAAISAGLTIAIGFASRDVLSNLVSGAFIVVDPKFHIGDWIEWDGKEGVIEDISFRVTRVHTYDNELISVPNSQLTTNAVKNPVAKDRLRVGHDFGIGYDDDVERAKAILLDVARRHDDVLDRPAASVRLEELADSHVGLRAEFWLANPRRADVLRIRSEYVQTVKERFDEADIEMPYPYRQLTGAVGTWEVRPDRAAFRDG